tara:strand:+ start:47 stop:424 length:378 start_codon:yes stop_codon:yes gene_type:complete
MPLPAALLAAAAGLGIKKAAKYGLKELSKLVTKQKKRAEKAKPKVDSGIGIKKSSRSGKGKLSRKVPISETGKGYAEQAYNTSIKVKVKFKDGKTITDSVKGMNEGHALARAKSNWPGSAVIKTK